MLKTESHLSQLQENIWSWSVFSEEKQLFFNGFVIRLPKGLMIIDPPSSDIDTLNSISGLGEPVLITLTNKDHERESQVFKKRFQIPIAIHELDAPLLEKTPEIRYKDGENLMDTLRVVHLQNQKSPGESALYSPDWKVLIVGDALIGKPAGELSMLPAEKFKDIEAARQSLKRLLAPDLLYDTVLVGDGENITHQGRQIVERFLQ